MWLRPKKHSAIAVDLGAVSLRAVQLEQRGGRVVIRHWVNQGTPADQQSEADENKDGTLSRLADARLVSRELFGGRDMVTTLGPPDIEVCSLQVPAKLLQQGHPHLSQAVRHEVARHVDFDVKAAEVGAWALPAGHADGPNVLVAVAQRSLIDPLLEWVAAQGCYCSRIDVAPLAVLRGCARMSESVGADQLWAVLDIGFRASRLYVGLGEIPVYVRYLPDGGDSMTRRVAAELDVEPAVAERYKRHYGVCGEAEGYRPLLRATGPADEKRMASILHGVLAPILRRMASEIEKSFRYAIDLYPRAPVSGLMLVGGGANLKGLGQVLGDKLGITVRCPSPDRLGDKYTEHPALAGNILPGMVTCIGTGYGGLSP